MSRKRPDVITRFWSKVKPPVGIGECWEWQAAKDKDGYGAFSIGTKDIRAHRFAYETVVAPIAEGNVIDHLCNNTSCVNPYHMQAVKQRLNALRGKGPTAINAVKTHCPRGHPLEGDNLVKYKLRIGKRICRQCEIERQRQFRVNVVIAS